MESRLRQTFVSALEEGLRVQQESMERMQTQPAPEALPASVLDTIGAAGGVITNGRPNALPLNVSTVADNLRSGGWRCLAAGKWDVGMHSWAVTPTFRGFEKFVGFCTSHDCPGLLPGLDCQL